MEEDKTEDDGIFQNSGYSSRMEEVFRNIVIWNRITMHLNLSDLKTMREVCTWMNQNVITDPLGFLKQSVFKLELNGNLESDTLISSLCIPWRNMNIILGNDLNSANIALASIPNFSECLETLTLSGDPKVQSWEWQTNWQWPHLVNRIIHECQKIHTVNAEFRLLESIHLFSPATEIVNIKHYRILTFDSKIPLHYTDICLQNLEAFGTRLTNLKTLRFSDFGTDGLQNVSLELRAKIHNMICKNCTTLTTLELGNWRFWQEEFELPLCPILKNLRARTLITNDFNSLTNFLKKQPMLERISISTRGSIKKELLSGIAVKSSTLRVFHLKIKNLVGLISQFRGGLFGPSKSRTLQQENPFTFLKELTTLEEFSLTVPKGGKSENSVAFVRFNMILINLPMTMRKISLRGLNGNGPIDLLELDLLYPKLSSLCLERCPGIVDNTSLNYLSNKRTDDTYPFPELVHLRISHCAGVTDMGLAGISENRKRLRNLVLQSCKLTDQCAEALKFRELEFLDVSGNSEITSAGIYELIRNNPNLTKLKCSVSGISNQGTRLTSIQYKDSQYDDDSDDDATNPRTTSP